ncbi:hypothetical protein PIB30_033135 [Stylosanthes scabra]|uniref:Uncharacterized protein n=1 Tax=Stylosanthes scabra TaxID=79078 RepID=A0ABU6WAE7_9FABA|nr:hypothetical protein [Stylosanthes scabra]
MERRSSSMHLKNLLDGKQKQKQNHSLATTLIGLITFKKKQKVIGLANQQSSRSGTLPSRGWKCQLPQGGGRGGVSYCGGGGGGYGAAASSASTSSSTLQPPNTSNTPRIIAMPPTSPTHLDHMMEALKDPSIRSIGMCYNHGDIIASEDIDRIKRRSERDSLFGSVVMVTVSKNPVLMEIQHQIADKLGIPLDGDDEARKGKKGYKYKMKKICCWGGKQKAKDVIISENAKKISEAIQNQQQQMNILFILSNLHKKLDLEKIGIPSSGVANSGPKFIFTSDSEELLSNHMNSDVLYKF